MNRKAINPVEIYSKRAGQPDFCSFKEVSDRFIVFLVCMEDPSFFQHRGYDLREIWRAVKVTLRGGNYGGSTITQQLVKNLFFSFERSYVRKIQELILSVSFEKSLTKKQILELYMNVVCFDNGQYGIRDASLYYFNKTPAELTLNQAFFLSALLPVVGIYNPLHHPGKFVEYRNKRLSLYSDLLTEEMSNEIKRHGKDCLDEELCRTSAENELHSERGPMRNERFGPGGTDCLYDSVTAKRRNTL